MEYSITGRWNSAATSRMMWMLSASSNRRWPSWDIVTSLTEIYLMSIEIEMLIELSPSLLISSMSFRPGIRRITEVPERVGS